MKAGKSNQIVARCQIINASSNDMGTNPILKRVIIFEDTSLFCVVILEKNIPRNEVASGHLKSLLAYEVPKTTTLRTHWPDQDHLLLSGLYRRLRNSLSFPVSPDPAPEDARGLYRRSGISPCPEDDFFLVWINVLGLYLPDLERSTKWWNLSMCGDTSGDLPISEVNWIWVQITV